MVLFVGGVVLAIGAAVAYRIVGVTNDLRAARTSLDNAERELLAGQPGAARASLAAGATRVIHANSRLYNSPELSLLRLIPVARQNLAALRSSVAVAVELTTGGNNIMRVASPLVSSSGHFEVSLRSGSVPLGVLQTLRPDLDDFARSLPLATEAPHSRLVLGPVRTLAQAVYRQAGLRRRQAASVARGIQLVDDLSGGNGPRRILIAVANAAEMRGSGGMILSYGELTAKDGTFSLEHFGGIDELQSKVTAPVARPNDVPADYLDRFKDLAPNLNFRNVNLTPDFRYAGSLLEAMYKQATGKTADGVIQIDSMGLAALLRGTGPVDVPDVGTINADNVVAATLSDVYARFPDQRDQRHEVLAKVASAVFNKLVTGSYPSLRPLATSLIDAAAERRILLHMARADEQQHVVALRDDGGLPDIGPDFATVAIQNFSGNKVDYYLDSGVSIRGSRRPGALGSVKVTVTLKNTIAPGATSPPSALGPLNGSLRAGQYDGLTSIYLPNGAALRGSTGDLGAGAAGSSVEGGRTLISVPVSLQEGEQRSVTLDVQLPPGAGAGFRWYLVPLSRVRPTFFDVDVDRGPARKQTRYTGPLVRPVVLSDGSFS